MRPRLLLDFALRCVHFYPGVISRAELVTLARGLRPERRFAPLVTFWDYFAFSCMTFIQSINQTILPQLIHKASIVDHLTLQFAKPNGLVIVLLWHRVAKLNRFYLSLIYFYIFNNLFMLSINRDYLTNQLIIILRYNSKL